MDGTYDMPIPEPPEAPEVVPVVPDSTAGISGYPLCRMLDRLEMFIEQPVPIPDMYADPLCRALDEVEASVERHDYVRNPVTEELYEVLCDLEYKIEHQPPVPADPKPILREDASTPEQKSFPQVIGNEKRRPLIPSLSRHETTDREPSSPRRYPRPTYRITGQNTGIRNTGHEITWYCNVHREWVSPDECDDCPDFEETDYVTEDEEDKRCKHSFTTLADDLDINEENPDSNDQTDE